MADNVPGKNEYDYQTVKQSEDQSQDPVLVTKSVGNYSNTVLVLTCASTLLA